MPVRPLSIRPQSGLNNSSIPSTSGSGPTKSHYRPFSSQSTESSSCLRRSASLGGLHHFCNNMGLQFGSKGRKDLVRPNSPADSFSSRPTKKRSMASIFASDPFTVPPSPSPRCSDELPLIDISKNHVSSQGLDASDKFTPKDVWAKRCNMKLHPYHKQVPYMQAYDPISLECDRYTDLLFQRLTNGSPSFHDYGKKPPAVVLDLGCGQGHWILHAANVWKDTEFVGLDVVDVTPPVFETVENIRLVRGDFVNYKFPFPDDTFDLVRMANIALCIPYDKWEFVLSQVHRVLTPGGRLELIDDDIYFPYGEGWKGLELEAPASPLGGSSFGGERLDVNDNETMMDDSNLMNSEAPFIAGAAGSIPVASDLLAKFADLRLPPSRTSHCLRSRKSSLPPPSDTSRITDLTSSISSRSPRRTRGDRHQFSGPKTFSRSATPHPVSPTTRKVEKPGNSPPPYPKRIKEKVALLPPIRSITPAFSLSSGSKYSPTCSVRTANASPTISDASSIRSTDTSPSTSVGSVVIKDDPENSVWQEKVSASKNMESLFEKMLVEQYGIHPRPSEFLLRVFGKIFCKDGNSGVGEAQVRMTKNFHIKLAPTESILDQSDDGHVGGKEVDHGGMEADCMGSTFSTVDTNSKAQNGIPVTSLKAIGPWPGRDKMDRPRTKLEKDKKKLNQDGRQSKHKEPQAGAIKTTATMTGSLFKRPQPRNPALSNPVRPTLSAKAAGVLGIPYSELSTVTLSLGVYSEERRSLVMPLPSSFPSNLSAKAAGRLGITYSEALSAAASLSVLRNAAHLTVPSSSIFSLTNAGPAPSNSTSGPVQHLGLLIWPDTYVPMAAGELEMHACKYIHTLLGCRLGLEEFVAKFVDERGDRFIGEGEFRDEIWEYECFRRARFNWPSEAAEPYEDDPTNSNANGPSSLVHCTGPNDSEASTAGNFDVNHSTTSTLDLPASSMTDFVSANGNDFGGPNEKLLRPTKSSLLLRSSPPTGQRSLLPPLKAKSKMRTSRNSRWASPAPSHPLSSSKDSSAKLPQSITEGNRGYRKLDGLVHLRSIKVFEGIKAA